MKMRSLLYWLLGAFAVIAPIHGTTDFFLNLEGVPGESTDAKYPKMIELETFSVGVKVLAEGSKPTFNDITFTKLIDKSSPLLFLNCASGKHLKEATLHVRRSPESFEFYTIRMSDVVITSVATSGSSGNGDLREVFSLNYVRIEFIYTPQRADGTADAPIHTGWDLKSNVPIP